MVTTILDYNTFEDGKLLANIWVHFHMGSKFKVHVSDTH